MKQNATLPSDYADDLKTLDRSSAQFLAHIVALRSQGWPLRAVADPLDVSRVTISNWAAKGLGRSDILQMSLTTNVPQVPFDAKGQGTSVKKIPKGIPEKDRLKIQELAPLAANNTRWVRKDSPERLASLALDDLVSTHVIDREVPAAVFAEVAGVTRRAIMQRVERVKGRS